MHCRMQDDCLGLTCCLSIPVPPFNVSTIKVSLSFDPCTMILTMELGNMKERKDLSPLSFAEEDHYSFSKYWTLFHSVKLLRRFKIERKGSFIEIYLAVKVCAKDICLPPMEIFKGVRISIPSCPSGGLIPPAKRVNFMEMTLGALEKEIFFFRPGGLILDNPGLNLGDLSTQLSSLVDGIRTTVKRQLIESIQMDMQGTENELDVVDRYLTGKFPMGPWDKTFFSIKPRFMVGPIPMYMRASVSVSLAPYVVDDPKFVFLGSFVLRCHNVKELS
ncbi:hypothetical protein Bbelb_053290 [Branchiostoma belcheri]|nr:hypothetical protein Bbelb_053290 [Branchiostoma belcheri]